MLGLLKKKSFREGLPHSPLHPVKGIHCKKTRFPAHPRERL